MTDFPDLKIKALVNFPSQAVGRTGIDVVKGDSNFYLDLNYAKFQITPTVPASDMPNSYNLIWDEVKKTFAKVPFALQATAGVSSFGGLTGAIAIDASLQMAGSTLKLAPFSYVSSLGGKTGALTIDDTLTFNGSALSVVGGGSAGAYDTRAAATAAAIPAVVIGIVVRRYTSADPLSNAPYKRGAGSASFIDALGSTWSLDLSGGVVNALWFGVKGDGATVNDAAWQAALDAAVAVGGKLQIPPGSFKLTTVLTINGRVTVEGVGYQGDNGLIYGNATTAPAFPTNPSGWRASVLVCGTTNGAFVTTTQSSVTLRDFQVFYPARPTAGTVAISLNSAPGTSGVNHLNLMRDLCIIGADKAMTIDNCLGFVMDGVIFLDTWDLPLQLSAGNSVQFTGYPNAASFGDSTIINCHFINTVGPYHLLLYQTGGLRIVNNKFNLSASIAIFIAPQPYTDPLTPTSHDFSIEPLIITGNSIEGSPVGIQFQPNSTSRGVCNQVTIAGNQIWTTTACISFVAGVAIPFWVYDVAITGNVLLFGSTAPATETGISVNGVDSMTISGNSIVSTVAGNVAVQFPTADYAVTHKIRMSGNIDSLSTPSLPGEVTPVIPASGVAATNNNPHPVMVIVGGGTKTGYIVNGSTLDQAGGGSFTLRPGDTIAVNYSATPTWHWYAVNP